MTPYHISMHDKNFQIYLAVVLLVHMFRLVNTQQWGGGLSEPPF